MFSGRTAATLAASVEASIQAGRLRPGDVLPPVRALARTRRLSPATVAAAYRQLRQRGLVAGAGRSGTRVAHRAAPRGGPAPAAVPGLIDLASSGPDPALLPPLDPALDALRRSAFLGDAAAPIDRGLSAFASGEFEADGVPPRALAVASGALDGIARVLGEYLRPGDRVGVEDPCPPSLLDLVAASAWTAVPIGLDARGPRPDALQAALGRGIRALVVTPRAQNPTGAAIDEARARELRRLLARQPDVVVVEHDGAAPIAGCALHPLRTAPDAPWAIVRSTSPFLGADLRVAVMAGDARSMARVNRRQALGPRWVSHLLQRMAAALWSDPGNARRLARAADVYAQRRQALQAALAAEGIATDARSGFYVWVPTREEAGLVAALAVRGWAVSPGERFRLQSAPGIRVTTSALDPADAVRFARDCAAAQRPSRSTPA